MADKTINWANASFEEFKQELQANATTYGTPKVPEEGSKLHRFYTGLLEKLSQNNSDTPVLTFKQYVSARIVGKTLKESEDDLIKLTQYTPKQGDKEALEPQSEWLIDKDFNVNPRKIVKNIQVDPNRLGPDDAAVLELR